MQAYLAEWYADGRPALWAVHLGVNVVKLSGHLGTLRSDGRFVTVQADTMLQNIDCDGPYVDPAVGSRRYGFGGNERMAERHEDRLEGFSRKRLAGRLSVGVTAKLQYDFACNRGHSFGEYHVHGVVNEILSANVDPDRLRVHSSYPHPAIQTEGALGRKRELDFLIKDKGDDAIKLCIEAKWAGSGHCTAHNLLLDLCRLHLVKRASPDALCLFVLAGRQDRMNELFESPILADGTGCLVRPGEKVNGRKHEREKTFAMVGHPHHQKELNGFRAAYAKSIPAMPDEICTTYAPVFDRVRRSAYWQALVWSVL